MCCASVSWLQASHTCAGHALDMPCTCLQYTKPSSFLVTTPACQLLSPTPCSPLCTQHTPQSLSSGDFSSLALLRLLAPTVLAIASDLGTNPNLSNWLHEGTPLQPQPPASQGPAASHPKDTTPDNPVGTASEHPIKKPTSGTTLFRTLSGSLASLAPRGTPIPDLLCRSLEVPLPSLGLPAPSTSHPPAQPPGSPPAQPLGVQGCPPGLPPDPAPPPAVCGAASGASGAAMGSQSRAGRPAERPKRLIQASHTLPNRACD